MTELGDRFREFAALCDSQPKFVAAGIVARPNETVVAVFTETEDRAPETVAIGLYHGVMTPTEHLDYFREAETA
jgi:hypothetical protein